MNFTNLEHEVAICSPRENFVDMVEPALDTIPILVLIFVWCHHGLKTQFFVVKYPVYTQQK